MTGSNCPPPQREASVINALADAQRIAITTHIRPDGDALGATIGLYYLLRDQGKHVQLVGLDPIPAKYRFLTADLPLTAANRTRPDDHDLLIVLDTGALDRTPMFASRWIEQITTLNIDHHPTNPGFGQLNWIDPAAAAVAEMITRLAVHGNWPISPAAAEALWVGITTDTGRFAYSSTTAATLTSGARLVAAGIDTNHLDQLVFNTLPLAALRLQARAIQQMELYHEQRLAVIALTQADLQACQARGEDADEVVNLPRKLDSVQVSLFLYEPDPQPDAAPSIKASFRTLPPFDASALCQQLGGGGHARAAGCTLPGSMPAARQQMLDLVNRNWFAP